MSSEQARGHKDSWNCDEDPVRTQRKLLYVELLMGLCHPAPARDWREDHWSV
jgi:hypothetical protein